MNSGLPVLSDFCHAKTKEYTNVGRAYTSSISADTPPAFFVFKITLCSDASASCHNYH